MTTPGLSVYTCEAVIYANWYSTFTNVTNSTGNVDRTTESNHCFGNINIKEEGIGITVTLCADDVRKRHVYTSSTNEVEVRVLIEDGKDASRFFMKFEGAK